MTIKKRNSRRSKSAGSSSTRKARPLRLPKHPRAFASGAKLPDSHYSYPYVFEAELPPKPCEEWVPKKILKNPWKPTNPSLINRKEFPHFVNLSEIAKGPKAPPSQNHNNPEDEPKEQANVTDAALESQQEQDKELWHPTHPTRSGREGDMSYPSYLSDMEMLLWIQTHDPEALRRQMEDMKQNKVSRIVPPRPPSPSTRPRGGPWMPPKGVSQGVDALFVPSYPYLSGDVMPANNYELWCAAQKYPHYQNFRNFKIGAGGKIIDYPIETYSRLPNQFRMKVLPRPHLSKSKSVSHTSSISLSHSTSGTSTPPRRL